jgi:uncharacterized damage-inducible protein DinB
MPQEGQMGTAAYFRALFAYNSWANARILDAAARLPAEQLDAAPVPGHLSLRATLVHALFGEYLWRRRWEGEHPTRVLAPEELPTLEAIRNRWDADEQVLRRLLAALDDGDLDRMIGYRTIITLPSVTGSLPLWRLLTHVAIHSVQHRTEAAMMLTALGQSPGNLDIVFFREHAEATPA